MGIGITINGRQEEMECANSVAQLLSGRGLNPDRVVVELNQRIVSREEYASAIISEGDRLELLSFVGGG